MLSITAADLPRSVGDARQAIYSAVRQRSSNSEPDWTSPAKEAFVSAVDQLEQAAMDRDAGERLITGAAAEIAQLAAAVNGLTQGATACAAGGNSGGAVRILLDVEPHLGEMQRLLDMASFVNRMTEQSG